MKMNDPRLAQILDHYGREHQRWKLIEECGELLAEFGRFRNGDLVNRADLIHECADVYIVTKQLWPVEASKSIEPPFDSVLTVVSAVNELVREAIAGMFGRNKERELQSAKFVLNHILWLMSSIGELDRFRAAVEFKIARQVERIEREAR